MRRLHLFLADADRLHTTMGLAKPVVSIERVEEIGTTDNPPITTPIADFYAEDGDETEAMGRAQRCALLLEDNGVKTMLDLSTAHMPCGEPDWGDERVSHHEHGVILFLRDDPSPEELEDMPAWLAPIYDLGWRAGAILVNFDRDAEAYGDLPTWEW